MVLAQLTSNSVVSFRLHYFFWNFFDLFNYFLNPSIIHHIWHTHSHTHAHTRTHYLGAKRKLISFQRPLLLVFVSKFYLQPFCGGLVNNIWEKCPYLTSNWIEKSGHGQKHEFSRDFLCPSSVIWPLISTRFAHKKKDWMRVEIGRGKKLNFACFYITYIHSILDIFRERGREGSYLNTQ